MKKINKILIAIALIIVTFLVSNSVLAETISRTFSTYNSGNGRPSGFYGVLAGTDNVAPLIKIVEPANTINKFSILLQRRCWIWWWKHSYTNYIHSIYELITIKKFICSTISKLRKCNSSYRS